MLEESCMHSVNGVQTCQKSLAITLTNCRWPFLRWSSTCVKIDANSTVDFSLGFVCSLLLVTMVWHACS